MAQGGHTDNRDRSKFCSQPLGGDHSGASLSCESTNTMCKVTRVYPTQMHAWAHPLLPNTIAISGALRPLSTMMPTLARLLLAAQSIYHAVLRYCSGVGRTAEVNTPPSPLRRENLIIIWRVFGDLLNKSIGMICN